MKNKDKNTCQFKRQAKEYGFYYGQRLMEVTLKRWFWEYPQCIQNTFKQKLLYAKQLPYIISIIVHYVPQNKTVCVCACVTGNRRQLRIMFNQNTPTLLVFIRISLKKEFCSLKITDYKWVYPGSKILFRWSKTNWQ